MSNNTVIQKASITDYASTIALIAISSLIVSYKLDSPYFCITIILSVILFLMLGYLLPAHTNKHIRDERSRAAKIAEAEKWGFQSRDRDGPWINYIDYPLIKETKFAKGKIFYSERLMIEDGFITVNPGPSIVDLENNTVKYDHSIKRTYAWDGCSPKIWIYWIVLVGTPDLWHKPEIITTLGDNGLQKEETKIWQLAHHASLVHDALYQYLGVQPIKKYEADLLFREMLIDSGMNKVFAWIYHRAVICRGGKEIDKNNSPSNSDFKIIN